MEPNPEDSLPSVRMDRAPGPLSTAGFLTANGPLLAVYHIGAGMALAASAPQAPADRPAPRADRNSPAAHAPLCHAQSHKPVYVRLPEPKTWRRIFPSVSISKGFCRKNALGSNMPCSEVMAPG
jgi:hypothetical protein